jgi:hypothetical protein
MKYTSIVVLAALGLTEAKHHRHHHHHQNLAQATPDSNRKTFEDARREAA